MKATDLIHAKRTGHKLGADEIEWAIQTYMDGEFTDYQMAALLMAIVWRGMDEEETLALTRAMIASGRVLSYPGMGITVDKHSTGGVGDKVSLMLAPLVSAAGLPVPMLSGRGLGHTGGTLDKLESIPGFTTRLGGNRFAQILGEVGWVMGGLRGELAPADGRLYALRDATATVSSLPLITSSILSKKFAAGPDVLVLDVKVGRGAFMKSRADAEDLAKTLVVIGTRLGKKIVAILSDMDQPLGRAVGNAIEVREAVDFLRGDTVADDLREITLVLASAMLVAAGRSAGMSEARSELEDVLARGAAYERFLQLVAAQGGNTRDIESDRLPAAPLQITVKSPGTGRIIDIDPLRIAEEVVDLGGGRRTMSDEIDPTVGVWLNRKRGETVRAGETIMTAHLPESATGREEEIAGRFLDAIRIGEDVPDSPLVYGVIGPNGQRDWNGWGTALPIA